MTDQTPKRITIDAPSEATILAARHLDATEGPAQTGSIVDAATRSAITTVLRYIAAAHNAPPVAGEKGVTRRPCRYCPDPLCPEDCPECGSPIHDLDAVPAQQRASRAEAALARIQALADEYPAGIDTALIHEALDTTTPAPAATEATDTQKSICDCPPTNAGLDLCTACPGRKTDDVPPPPMAAPSEETSRLIGQHLAEREAQGREPYWPNWDD